MCYTITMKQVRKIAKLKYIDGNGEIYYLEDVIIIDMTNEKSLETLLEEALDIENENTIR